ncbi:MAG: hypothetical protein KBT19_06915 [Lachnospiraceae bacterium]|nr:hypothetical protein [Candidatus Colinaster equi]
MGMDIGAIMKIKGAWERFAANHPKFPMFISAVSKKGIKEGTIIEIGITDPDGTVMNTNIKISASDLELVDLLKSIK